MSWVQLSVSDEFECQLKCLGNDSCKSLNVDPGADNGRHICELNNKTRLMKPRDFRRKKGSSYYGAVKVSGMFIITILMVVGKGRDIFVQINRSLDA